MPKAGELKDSSLIAKKIGIVHFSLFASSSYVKKFGSPTHPRELKDHACLQFSPIGVFKWKLSSSKGSVSIPLSGKVLTNDLNMVKTLAILGDGIGLLPTFLCRVEAERGRLVQVLPEWRANVRPVHFLYPPQKFELPKLRAFIDYATEPLRERLRSFEI